MSLPLVVFLFALLCVTNSLSSDEITKAKNDEEIHLGQLYGNLDKELKNLVRENLKSVLRVFVEISRELNVSTKCMGNALKLHSGLRDLNLWALNFVDAIGKPGDGLLSGSVHMLGNYDQCLRSSALKKNGDVDFRGQYCLVSLLPHLPNPEITPEGKDRISIVQRITLNLTEPVRLLANKAEINRIKSVKIGLCVPSGCDTSDVDKLIKYGGERILMNLTLEYCETEDSPVYFNSIRIGVLCIYLFFIILACCASVIEQYSKAKKIKFENIMMRSIICFSIPHNFSKFMGTKTTDKNLSCLHGIRVLTLFYVILGHHYYVRLDVLMARNMLVAGSTWVPRFFFQIILNGILSVDIFFFIGGFLNCYLRAKRNFTNFSLSSSFRFLIYRLMRIYPALIAGILLLFLLFPRGPLNHHVEKKYLEPCVKQWWTNILFINNFYDIEYQCSPQTWYLAVDMQCFLISLFTIPLLFRNPKIGVLVNLAIILISIIFTSVQFGMENVTPGIMPLEAQSEKTVTTLFKIYNSLSTHASPYFGGVLLGYYVAKKRDLKCSKIAQFFGWVTASTLFCTMLFGTKNWNSGYPWTQLEGALYFSLSKPLYSWSVGWLIFCCYAGHGGIINYILSLKLWVPLNRLCLTAYIISVSLQLNFNTNLRSPLDAQTEIEIWCYFGDLAVTLLFSLPMMLLFESPFIDLQKIIFPIEEDAYDHKETEIKGKEIFQIKNVAKCDKDKYSIKM